VWYTCPAFLGPLKRNNRGEEEVGERVDREGWVEGGILLSQWCGWMGEV